MLCVSILNQKSISMQDCLFVKNGSSHCRISFEELQYVEAEKRYVRFVTAEKVYLTEGPLYKVEHLLPSDQFCRIHRSYIVSLHHAKQYDAKAVTVGSKQLPIGRHYRNMLSLKVLIIDGHMVLSGKEINHLFNPPGQD
jgi:DNA-binding LytR/AlgR family response regulator